MSGFHILRPSWTAGASVTSNSNAALDLAASNLVRIQPSWFWQSSVLSIAGVPLRLTLDAGEARPWNTVSLLYTNAFDGTIRVTSHGSTGSLFTTPAFDTDDIGSFDLAFPGDLSGFPERHVWVAVDTVQTHRFIGIEIDDVNNPDGFFQAGGVMAGVRFTPKIGAQLGSSSGYDDPSVSVELMSGETIVRPKRSKAVGRWSFPKQDQADTMVWRHINFAYGGKIPVIFKWDPVLTSLYQQHTFYYGFMQWRSGGAFAHSVGRGRYDVEVGIREV